MGLKNYLIDGVSCAGKTTVCNELRRLGHHTVNGDDELAYWGEGRNWIWNVEKVRALAADQTREATFFCGGSRNSDSFIDLFDEVFVLEIDEGTLNRRLAARPQTEWGGTAREGLPRHAVPIDATAPLSRVVSAILRLSLNYKTQLKTRIPEGVLQFCELGIVDRHLDVLLWTTVSPDDNVLDLVHGPSEGSQPQFLGVFSDMDVAAREARVTLVFQDQLNWATGKQDYPASFDRLKERLPELNPALPFVEQGLVPDTSGVEYWRRCRKHIGHDALFGPAAGAFVTDGQGRFLLQRRGDDGTWGILGGGCEIGESPVENARREVLEESGLEVSIERLLSIATGDDCAGEYPNGDKGKFWGFLFLAKVTGGTLIESNEETLELKWFGYDEIEALPNKSTYLAHNYENLRNTGIKVLAKKF